MSRSTVRLHDFALFAGDASIVAGFTDRHGGVSAPPYDSLNLGLHVDDEADHVIENRRRVAVALGVELDDMVFPRQVHGSDVAVVEDADRGRGTYDWAGPAHGFEAAIEADALITTTPGPVLAVLVADCVPIVLFDPIRSAIGVVHAGWRGTVAGIAAKTVAAMGANFGSRPEDIYAAFGPSIGPESFTVGENTAAEFLGVYGEGGIVLAEGEQPRVDLRAANRHELIKVAGLNPVRVTVDETDTFTSAAHFSHRHRNPTGRFAVIACLRSGRQVT